MRDPDSTYEKQIERSSMVWKTVDIADSDTKKIFPGTTIYRAVKKAGPFLPLPY